MPKGSEELTNARKNEIIDACARLYECGSFKDITIKDIGGATSFTRTSVYNYFRTKEEIFLALLQREYERWNGELSTALENRGSMSRAELAELLADTLSRRGLMLRLLSMNMYDIEENSGLEKLTEFKRAYGRSLELTAKCVSRCVPGLGEEGCLKFLYAFFPFVYGIYPYTSATEKQLAAMEAAGLCFYRFSIYELALSAAKMLLGVED